MTLQEQLDWLYKVQKIEQCWRSMPNDDEEDEQRLELYYNRVFRGERGEIKRERELLRQEARQ